MTHFVVLRSGWSKFFELLLALDLNAWPYLLFFSFSSLKRFLLVLPGKSWGRETFGCQCGRRCKYVSAQVSPEFLTWQILNNVQEKSVQRRNLENLRDLRDKMFVKVLWFYNVKQRESTSIDVKYHFRPWST